MTSIYLIRHGQASFHADDYDQLSLLGEQQSEMLGAAFAQRIGYFDRIYVGAMKRHHQTADACLKTFPNVVDKKQHEGWNEYDFQDVLIQASPDFESFGEIREFMQEQENPQLAFQAFFHQAVARWYGSRHDDDYVEKWASFEGRVKGALATVVKESQDMNIRNVAVFTSGGPISLLAQSLLGIPIDKMVSLNSTLVNCGVTKLVSAESRTFVSSLNDHAHFESDRETYLTYI